MLKAMDPRTRESDAVGDQSKANGLYLRLMSQWLQLHQFLALEGLQAHRLAKVLRQGGSHQPDRGAIARPAAAGARGAWGVLALAWSGLMGVTPEQLLQADYRRDLPEPNAALQTFDRPWGCGVLGRGDEQLHGGA